jgi:iron complex outermembrane receptor protein
MMNRNSLFSNTKLIIIQSLSLILALPLTAQAQGVLEEIVVTAEYREENLQDVPVAVTAFSADEITRAGIESTQDFINLTPNVTLDDSFTLGNTFVQVRGVAQINNADSPIAIVVDGVPQNNQKQFKQELFDIERIEVLKGPQGSLYGRNAIGGAINIVTKAPTNELEGFVKAGYGNGDQKKVSGGLSGAIIPDKLLFRIAGAYKDFDGVVNNTFLDETVDFFETKDIRGKLIWNATDDITVEARIAYSDADGGCCSDTFIFNELIGNAPNPTGIPTPNNNEYNKPRMNVRGKTDKLQNFDTTLKINWDLGEVEATYIFNHSDVEEEYFADLDFTEGVDDSLGFLFTNVFFGGLPVGANQQQLLDVEFTSHELRFASAADQRLRWIGGMYYLETERRLTTTGDFDFTPTTPIFSRDAFSGVAFVDLEEENDNDAWAVFGQLEYDIFEDLELAIGLRYDEDKRRHNGRVIGVPGGTAPRKKFSDVQPRAVLTKRFSDDLLMYAGYSRGFRSGGFNGPAIGSPQFNEETLDNFEIGVKSDLMDGRLRVNASFFYGLSDDFQFFFVDLVTASQVIANIEEVDIYGGELEVQALLTDDWSVYGTLGITDTEIKKSVSRPQDEGNRTPKNQKYSLNVGTQYVQTVGNITGRLRVDYEHRGRKYWHPDNANSMDPFGLLNARLSFETENITLSLWGKNIGDTSYWQDYNSATFSGAFGDIGFLARGRTYGVDVQYNF